MNINNALMELARENKKLTNRVGNLERLLVVAPLHAGKAKVTTIVDDIISVTRPHVQVVPETGTADDIIAIENFGDGKFIVVSPERVGDTITIVDYTNAVDGNIDLRGIDAVLTDPNMNVLLYYVESTERWHGIGSADDGGEIFTDAEKIKLAGIEDGAQVNTINSIVGGENIEIDYSDSLNPIINATVQSGELIFFFEDAASSIGGGYKLMDNPISELVESYVTYNTPVDGGLVQVWVSALGTPGVTFVPGGVWEIHVNAYKTGGTNVVQLYAEFYKRDVGGTETLLGTTQDSLPLTTVEVALPTFYANIGDTILLETDRLVCKVRVSISGVGSDSTSVTVGYSGPTAARMGLPGQSYDTTTFVKTVGGTTVGSVIDAAANDTPLDADKFGFWDVVDGVLKSVTWANIKSAVAGLYVTLTGDQTIQGIKTFTDPTSATVVVEAQDGISGVRLDSYRESNNEHVRFVGRAARGTLGAPAALTAGTKMLTIAASGYHSGAAFGTTNALFELIAAENWTSIAQGTYLALYTTAIGATVRAEAMRINSAGDIGIGTTDIEASQVSYGSIHLGLTSMILYGKAVFGSYYIDNAYYDGSWKRRTANPASFLATNYGEASMYVTGTGAIDSTIAWVQALTAVEPYGYVGVGNITPDVVTPSFSYAAATVALMKIGGKQYGALTIQGSISAALNLIDTGAAAGQRWTRLLSDAATTSLQAVDDAGALIFNGFSFNHANGQMTMRNSVVMGEAVYKLAAVGQNYVQELTYDVGDITSTQAVTFNITFGGNANIRTFLTYIDFTGARNGGVAVWAYLRGWIAWAAVGSVALGSIKDYEFDFNSTGITTISVDAIANGVSVTLDSSAFTNVLNNNMVTIRTIGDASNIVTVTIGIA